MGKITKMITPAGGVQICADSWWPGYTNYLPRSALNWEQTIFHDSAETLQDIFFISKCFKKLSDKKHTSKTHNKLSRLEFYSPANVASWLELSSTFTYTRNTSPAMLPKASISSSSLEKVIISLSASVFNNKTLKADILTFHTRGKFYRKTATNVCKYFWFRSIFAHLLQWVNFSLTFKTLSLMVMTNFQSC